MQPLSCCTFLDVFKNGKAFIIDKLILYSYVNKFKIYLVCFNGVSGVLFFFSFLFLFLTEDKVSTLVFTHSCVPRAQRDAYKAIASKL